MSLSVIHSYSRCYILTLLVLHQTGPIIADYGIQKTVAHQARAIAEAYSRCFPGMESAPLTTSGVFCNRTWDNLMCWPSTPAGTLALQNCAKYINGFNSQAKATKQCMHTGEWFFSTRLNSSWTDYTGCTLNNTTSDIHPIIREHVDIINLIYHIGYSISLIFLVIAVFIMVYFKKLHCQRNTIHINLFVSFILRAAIWLLKTHLMVESVGLPDDIIYAENGDVEFKHGGSHWECRLLQSVFFYIWSANYMWIFVEGLYLYTLIFIAMFSERRMFKLYIVLGWTFPLTFVLPWVFVRIYNDNLMCWTLHGQERYFWILKGPIMISIVVNFLFFLRIVWALFSKLRSSSRMESRRFQYRRLAKSTLVLIPLFGVHYIVSILIPETKEPAALVVAKLYMESILTSFQGFMVVVLFCFLNGEVRTELTKRFLPRTISIGATATTTSVVVRESRDWRDHAPAGRTIAFTVSGGSGGGEVNALSSSNCRGGGETDSMAGETMEMLPRTNGHVRSSSYKHLRGFSDRDGSPRNDDSGTNTGANGDVKFMLLSYDEDSPIVRK